MKDGYTWRSSNVHLAKLKYRQAQFYRRPGSFDSVMALRYIFLALELLPDDPVLRKGARLNFGVVERRCERQNAKCRIQLEAR
jgi:hypothetical protein